MGIHAKYDLTKYMFQDKRPETFYSVDQYTIVRESRIYDLTFTNEYDIWEEVRDYIDAAIADDPEDEFSISVVGLVFN